jgi:hypothetical protein
MRVSILENYVDRILLDYDVKYEVFMDRYYEIIRNRAKTLLGNLLREIGVSKSQSGNTHVVLYLSREIPERLAIIIAFFMGSDAKRECFNWFRLVNFGSSDSVFFNEYTKKASRDKCNKEKEHLRKMMLRRCPGLVIYAYKYAQLVNYLGWKAFRLLVSGKLY